MDKVLHDYIDTILGISFKQYQKSWYEKIDKTFFTILSIVMICTFLFISYLANKNYSITGEIYTSILQKKYMEVLNRARNVRVQFDNDIYNKSSINSQKVIVADFHRKPVTPQKNKIKLESENKEQELLAVLTAKTDEYEGLPELEFDYLELSDNLIATKIQSNYAGRLNKIPINQKGSIDIIADEEFDPWPYEVERQGDTFFETSDAIYENKEKLRGWRDPQEITLAMQNRERMVEYCYRKESKNFTNLSGYVLVRFIILHSGIVDPASVQILESSLFNKRIELCIKRALMRYRGFESLDESMGSVAVVQKFIFN